MYFLSSKTVTSSSRRMGSSQDIISTKGQTVQPKISTKEMTTFYEKSVKKLRSLAQKSSASPQKLIFEAKLMSLELQQSPLSNAQKIYLNSYLNHIVARKIASINIAKIVDAKFDVEKNLVIPTLEK